MFQSSWGIEIDFRHSHPVNELSWRTVGSTQRPLKRNYIRGNSLEQFHYTSNNLGSVSIIAYCCQKALKWSMAMTDSYSFKLNWLFFFHRWRWDDSLPEYPSTTLGATPGHSHTRSTQEEETFSILTKWIWITSVTEIRSKFGGNRWRPTYSMTRTLFQFSWSCLHRSTESSYSDLDNWNQYVMQRMRDVIFIRRWTWQKSIHLWGGVEEASYVKV